MEIRCPCCKTDGAIHTTASVSYFLDVDGKRSLLIEDVEDAQCSDSECGFFMKAEDVEKRIIFELED